MSPPGETRAEHEELRGGSLEGHERDHWPRLHFDVVCTRGHSTLRCTRGHRSISFLGVSECVAKGQLAAAGSLPRSPCRARQIFSPLFTLPNGKQKKGGCGGARFQTETRASRKVQAAVEAGSLFVFANGYRRRCGPFSRESTLTIFPFQKARLPKFFASERPAASIATGGINPLALRTDAHRQRPDGLRKPRNGRKAPQGPAKSASYTCVHSPSYVTRRPSENEFCLLSCIVESYGCFFSTCIF
jgi:hypothetical protein